MKFDKIEQVGRVLVKQIKSCKTDKPVYSDGPVENELYHKFKCNPNYGANSDNIKFPSWAHEYHLSPVRHNLLKWYPFNPDGSVLEVGAGCGALTGLLCSKLKKVTALEYSEKRARVTAQRHCERPNLEVIVGGLQDFECEEQFDYITVIGVLEYAGQFHEGENPYQSFLAKLRNFLKPDGTLILAIENKIGLKYICGAQEDHTGRVFDSIYDYPYPCKVKTFSKKELTDLLYAAGFCSLEWYYPLPDYKMPQEVISEEITPTDLDSIWRLFPARTGRRRRKQVISERRLGKTLAQAGLFGEFANSFLVIARTKDVRQESRCLRFIGANMARKSRFRTNKQISVNGREKIFILRPDNDEGTEFLHEIARREALAKTYFGKEADVITGRLNYKSLIYSYMPFPTMLELMSKAIGDGDSGFGRSWIDKYLQFLLRLPAKRCVPEEFMRELGISDCKIPRPVRCLRRGIVDCVPHNILIDEKSNKYYVIDNEFTYDFPIPVDFLIWRAIHTLVVDLQDCIQSQVCEGRPVAIFSGHGLNRHYMPLSWLDVLKNLEIPLKEQAQWSSAFQNNIRRHKSKLYLRLKAKPRALKHVPIAEMNVNHKVGEQIYKVLHKARRIW